MLRKKFRWTICPRLILFWKDSRNHWKIDVLLGLWLTFHRLTVEILVLTFYMHVLHVVLCNCWYNACHYLVNSNRQPGNKIRNMLVAVHYLQCMMREIYPLWKRFYDSVFLSILQIFCFTRISSSHPQYMSCIYPANSQTWILSD